MGIGDGSATEKRACAPRIVRYGVARDAGVATLLRAAGCPSKHGASEVSSSGSYTEPLTAAGSEWKLRAWPVRAGLGFHLDSVGILRIVFRLV